jgi:hypothetical protein
VAWASNEVEEMVMICDYCGLEISGPGYSGNFYSLKEVDREYRGTMIWYSVSKTRVSVTVCTECVNTRMQQAIREDRIGKFLLLVIGVSMVLGLFLAGIANANLFTSPDTMLCLIAFGFIGILIIAVGISGLREPSETKRAKLWEIAKSESQRRAAAKRLGRSETDPMWEE